MRLLILTTLLAISFSGYGNWFDKAKEQYNNLETQVKQKISGNKKKEPLVLPKNIPTDWHVKVIKEPVFNSKMLLVESGLKNSQTIILVHGLGQNGHIDWIETIELLKHKYHVLSFDFPGFGYSEKPKGQFSPKNYAKLVQWLIKNFAHQFKVTVVGHSMGGAVAIRLTADYPEVVDKLLLIDVAGILQRTAYIKHVSSIPVSANAPGIVKKTLNTIDDLSDSFVELANSKLDISKDGHIWTALSNSTPNVNAAMQFIEENFSSALRKISHDVHIVWGVKDPVTPLRTGKMIAYLLKGAQLSLIEGAGHVPMKTHFTAYSKWLIQSLNKQSVGANYQPKNSKLKNRLECKNKTGIVYSGSYKTVVIDHCAAVTLKNLYTNQLIIRDSVVQTENIIVKSNSTALRAVDSVILDTNSLFEGRIAVQLHGSRLDFAGTTLSGTTNAMRITLKSRLVLSVCEIKSPSYNGFSHATYTIKKGNLDDYLF
ncbi:MAG: alpha/beta hydrolase [Methylococcales bacterium]|jgi:pimeloyl-ACP methyl ester carboxylesterase|nr:alpha/beta hydrolase [Methylococcales bacterium]